MKSQSGVQQPLIQSYQNALLISFNSIQKERTDPMMGTQAFWECDQVRIDGIPTKSNIAEAIKRELEAQLSVSIAAELDAFKAAQDNDYSKAMAAYKSTNKIVIADAKATLTKDQKAGYLALVDFQESIENKQARDFAAKEKELSGADFTSAAALVAGEVIKFLNQ